MNPNEVKVSNVYLVRSIVRLTGPAFLFCTIVVPLSALIYAVSSDSIKMLNYVHITSGVLWAGADILLGFVIRPTLEQLTREDRAKILKWLIPKVTFYMTTMAIITTTSGIELADSFGYTLQNIYQHLWVLAALVIAALLSLQALLLIIPNEIRIFRQLLANTPDEQLVARLGMLNMKLITVQGILQIIILVVMTNIRF